LVYQWYARVLDDVPASMRGSRSTARQMTRTQWFVLNRGVSPLPASNTPQCTEEIPHILFVPFKLPAVHRRLTALAGLPVSISLFCLPREIYRTKALLAYGRLSTCVCNHVFCGSNGAMVYFSVLTPRPRPIIHQTLARLACLLPHHFPWILPA
jgi:hypothetical protein